jgi:hypothetical protein
MKDNNIENTPVQDIEEKGGSINPTDGALLTTLDKLFKQMRLKHEVGLDSKFVRISMGNIDFWFVNKKDGVYNGWGYDLHKNDFTPTQPGKGEK